MNQLIAEMLMYAAIAAGMVFGAWILRDFMLNHNHLPRRSLPRHMLQLGSLAPEEELEIPVETERQPSRDQWLKPAIQSPAKTAMIIRKWLKENGAGPFQTKVHA